MSRQTTALGRALATYRQRRNTAALRRRFRHDPHLARDVGIEPDPNAAMPRLPRTLL